MDESQESNTSDHTTENSSMTSAEHSDSGESTETSRRASRSSSRYFDYSNAEEEEYSEEEVEEKKEKILIQKIFTHRTNDNNEIEFLCKVKGRSYKNAMWIQSSSIRDKHGSILRHKYVKNYITHPPEPPYYNSNYDIPEHIISSRIVDGKTQYLIKWTDLDYDQVTWENENDIDCPALLKQFEEYNQLPDKKELFFPAHPKPESWKPLTSFPSSKSGYNLRPYQLEGLNFFVNSWYNSKNPILADEMGLGKTVQATVFLKYIATNEHIRGPFMVVAPLSTLAHWEREIAEWTDFKVLTYHGGRDKRNLMKQYEFFFPGTTITKFQVLLTTYELCIREENLLRQIEWRAIVVDEAHRLKNKDSKLITVMRTFKVDFKVLMTGTPLQNNTDELWSLLNFIDEGSFDSLQEFQTRFGELTENEQIIELQSLLKPRMLRRLKSDVEKAIAPMEEVIIECPMTGHQKLYYQSIFSNNVEYLQRGLHKNQMANMKNIHMELRKVCNHPYLINGAEDQILIERKEAAHIPVEDQVSQEFIDDALIRSSGKMILLDKLLTKLKADGHRVLIFSQMVKMLDIIQDYCAIKEYSCVRLDGSIRGDIRQDAIDRYNAPDSDIFIFLICTKAGGLGINLTSADTVIIYDSDWNPQNDIQATARCHRIGQTKEVHVYRFITAKSYERKMFDRASIKLGLGSAVLEQTKEQKAEEMEKLLRYGAYYAFEEDKDKDAETKFTAESIDNILTRSTRIIHNSVIGTNSTFSKVQFEIEAEKEEQDLMTPDFWQKYLPAVVEEEVIDGVSIGERRRIMREGISAEQLMQEQADRPQREHREPGTWSKNKVSTLASNLLRYGWGRWKVIYERSQLNFPIGEIKAVCHIFLRWLLSKDEDKQYPVMEAIYNMPMQGQTDSDLEFEKKWQKKHKKEYEPIITGGFAWKLSRLDLLHFLNQLVVTTPNPPDEIPVPTLITSKIADWWGIEDDRALIYGVWQNGFANYNDLVFPNQPKDTEKIDPRQLTNRLRSLVHTLKIAFIKLKQSKNEDVSFSASALKEATETWSKKEHKLMIHALINYGYPGANDFREAAQLTGKSLSQVETYFQAVDKYTKEIVAGNEDAQQGILCEKITIGTASRIQQRIEFFKDVRETAAAKTAQGDDQQLLDHVAKFGYMKLDEEFIVNNYGPPPLEAKVSKRLKEIMRGTPGSSFGRTKGDRQKYLAITYEKNEDGTPVYPIKCGTNIIINSIGTIVYDRPSFHTERYFYTPGFESERLYTSCIDPAAKEWYVSKIIDEGGPDPVFKVELKSDPEKYHWEWNRPSNPWLCVIKAVETRKKELGLPSNRSMSISGPDYFGLSIPVVTALQMELPGADRCSKFNRKKPEEEAPEESSALASTRKRRQEKARSQEKLLLPTTLTINFGELLRHPQEEEYCKRISIVPESLIDRDRLDFIFPQSNDPARSAIETVAYSFSSGEQL